jgi:hypothetical protein
LFANFTEFFNFSNFHPVKGAQDFFFFLRAFPLRFNKIQNNFNYKFYKINNFTFYLSRLIFFRKKNLNAPLLLIFKTLSFDFCKTSSFLLLLCTYFEKSNFFFNISSFFNYYKYFYNNNFYQLTNFYKTLFSKKLNFFLFSTNVNHTQTHEKFKITYVKKIKTKKPIFNSFSKSPLFGIQTQKNIRKALF